MMRNAGFSCVLLIAWCHLGLVAAAQPLVAAADNRAPAKEAKPAATSPSRAAWMPRGTFGVMTHYLIEPKGNTPAQRTADLNRTADRFDLDGYIRQIEATQADWLIFTLGQCTGYLCSPNEHLEARSPGRCSSRDLALEIARRLKPLGKRLILYLPSEQNADPAIRQAFQYGTPGQEDRYFAFLREYSLRFGTLQHGWWFDSCGPQPDAYWRKYLDAVRAGNPKSAVAFSGAEFCCGGPINPITRLSDYHAGEIHLLEDGKIRRDFLPPGGDIIVTPQGKLRKRGQEARYYLPDGPAIDGVQWHGLLPIDLTFNPAIPNQFCHYTDKELVAFVRHVKSVGGALTINVPIDVETGLIPEDSHSQLVRLGKAISRR
jgi:hypothetical protein